MFNGRSVIHFSQWDNALISGEGVRIALKRGFIVVIAQRETTSLKMSKLVEKSYGSRSYVWGCVL